MQRKLFPFMKTPAKTNLPPTCCRIFEIERSTQNIEDLINFMHLSIAKYRQKCNKNYYMENNKLTSYLEEFHTVAMRLLFGTMLVQIISPSG